MKYRVTRDWVVEANSTTNAIQKTKNKSCDEVHSREYFKGIKFTFKIGQRVKIKSNLQHIWHTDTCGNSYIWSGVDDIRRNHERQIGKIIDYEYRKDENSKDIKGSKSYRVMFKDKTKIWFCEEHLE